MIGGFKDAASCWKEIMSDAAKGKELLPVIGEFARTNTARAKIEFGTSGWRGEIGSDFTFCNVRKVTTALIEMLKSGEGAVMEATGVADFEEIKRRGAIVGHDNRFLGHDFSMEVMGLLRKEGICTWYAGEAATPEFSAAVEMLGAACAINLTPSHNPANYGGFKFNPSDGGPAGSEITARIEERVNRMTDGPPLRDATPPAGVERVDLAALYIRYIKERGTLDVETIRAFVQNEDCIICVDHMHGATRGLVERIIDESPRIHYLRTDDDYLFGGAAPEPSEKNMEGVERILGLSGAALRLGAIMDPDGDRIRFSDGTMQIPMSYFGAMALHFLHVHKGLRGIVAKSVGTSNFVNAIAEKLGVTVRETKVGFKNFRPYMRRDTKEKAVVVFEESDGISGYNHTLEKDALFGLLLAIEMMAKTGKNLGVYLRELMDEYGYYYPDRSGIALERLRAGEALAKKLSLLWDRYKPGKTIVIGHRERTVTEVITLDGTKVVFDDGSWLMIRPSGTEPKVRFYIEARTGEGKRELFDAAERMTKEALGMI